MLCSKLLVNENITRHIYPSFISTLLASIQLEPKRNIEIGLEIQISFPFTSDT